jgi:hypothetical protein
VKPWWTVTAVGTLMIAMAGCASLGMPHRPEPGLATIVRAYQEGVRDGAAHLGSEHERDLRTPWTAPVVQEVWVPARIVDAIFIPAHREWVVIHPAEWAPWGGRAQAATPDRAAPRTERHP